MYLKSKVRFCVYAQKKWHKIYIFHQTVALLQIDLNPVACIPFNLLTSKHTKKTFLVTNTIFVSVN